MNDWSPILSESYVVFGIAPERLAKVRDRIKDIPHKFLIGTYKGKAEPSCLMPSALFFEDEAFLTEGEESFLFIGTGRERRVQLIFTTGGFEWLGELVAVASPKPGEDFTFDPSTEQFLCIRNRDEASQ